MQNGANSVHKLLRTELEDYIKSQYFGKSPLLLSALSNHIDDEGLLYQKPFIESSPAYVTVPNGINTASIEPWMKEYFLQLAQAGIGVSNHPSESADLIGNQGIHRIHYDCANASFCP